MNLRDAITLKNDLVELMRVPNPPGDAQSAPFVLYHGARGWDGEPSVRPAKKGRTEHGPGLYFTTSYETARKYSKGGGQVLRVFLAPDLRWLDRVVIDLQDALDFVAARPRLPAKEDTLARLKANSERMASRIGPGRINADVLVNLLVASDALTGKTGPAVAAFLVEHGVDASLVEWSSGANADDWVVLFNPAKILRTEIVRATEVFGEKWSLPLLRGRRAAT